MSGGGVSSQSRSSRQGGVMDQQLLKEAWNALDSLWAAIGDRLLAKGPLAKEYANSVCAEIRAAQAKIAAALSLPNGCGSSMQHTTRTRGAEGNMRIELDQMRAYAEL